MDAPGPVSDESEVLAYVPHACVGLTCGECNRSAE